VQKYYVEARELLKLSFPVWITQLTQVCIGLIDTVMAGTVSPTDMAAVSVAGSIWLPVILFGHGLLQAPSSIIAQLKGAGAYHKIKHQVWQSLWLALFIAFPIIGILHCSDGILAWVIAHRPAGDSKLPQMTLHYLRIMIFGVPGYLFYLVFRCLCEALSKTRPTMFIGVIGLLINIPINYIFIHGYFGAPALGGVGCGVATATVYWILFLSMLCYVLNSQALKPLKLFTQFEWPHFKTLAALIKLGVPIGFSYFFEVTLFAVAALLITPFGDQWVAGHQVAMTFSSLVFTVPFSIGIAVSVRVSNRLGEQAPDQAKTAAHTGLAMGLLLALLASSTTVIWRSSIAGCINGNSVVQSMAMQLMLFAAAYECLDALQVIANGILRGYQDTLAVFLITLVSYWLLGFSSAYVLGLSDWIVPAMGARGIWYSFIIAIASAASLLLLRLRWIQRLKKATLLQRITPGYSGC
jgi:MATE family multidrug resistance protein